MSLADLVLPFIIAICAVIYAVFAGRAQASRLRNFHVNVSNGSLSGYLVILAVIAMVVASFVF